MPVHSFHIPVMGTGFTIDTPLKVARYGISSVISLVDDKLIEKMRRYYCGLYREDYVPILESEEDGRARRITEYLNLVDRLVQRQIEELKKSPFEPGSEISKYFEGLDDGCVLKREYQIMLTLQDAREKAACQSRLRERVEAGSVDVNIMTKVDRENFKNGNKLSREFSDALAALRGFAKSALRSSVVFSAGLNLPLYGYLSAWDDFYADSKGEMKKKVILKVSDFRSAMVQAKVLAKKGIWVSEYRVESGLNCGGHAFPTDGYLLGPILEEFKSKREELIRSLFDIYQEVLWEKRGVLLSRPPAMRLTAQGGAGSAAEHEFLLRYFELDSVGWGTPFLLVPEATTVDDDTLARLAAAGEKDVYLSHASPLGVPFYNLKNSASEEMRKQRIASGRPGSPCLNKFLVLNTEYEPSLCTASFEYQNKKITELKEKKLSGEDFTEAYEKIVEKACICRDLGDGALLKYGIPDRKKTLTPAVCPGPNIVYFSRILSLKEMVDHIYGRTDVISPAVSRPHLFINELKIYVDYLKGLVSKPFLKITRKEVEYFNEFKQNLFDGIEYYGNLVESIREESRAAKEKFVSDLQVLKTQLENLAFPAAIPAL